MSEEQNEQQPNVPSQDDLSDQELNNVAGGIISFDGMYEVNPDALKNAKIIGNSIPEIPPPLPGPASKV